LLEFRARQSPDSEAILAPRRAALTFERLFAQVQQVQSSLITLGIHHQDKLAIVLPNGPEMAVAFLAVACGAVAAPLNPAYGPSEFEFHLSDLRAGALLVEAGVSSTAREVARERGISIIEIVPKPAEAAGLFCFQGVSSAPGPSPRLPEQDDIALVLHTSGTTSRPKMVSLTHQNLCASARDIGASLELTPSDRCLNIMPLFHIHGLVAALLSSLAAGASVVATPGFDAPNFFDWVGDFQPTWYTAVPTMHRAILARGEQNPGEFRPGRLRFIRSSSAALPPSLMAELEGKFGVPVVEAYGTTETSAQATANPLPPGIRKPGSAGVATGTEAAIMEKGGARLMARDEVGEIVVRGPKVVQGYANQVAEQAFATGWFRTGDLGRIDREGYLYIEGRIKEVINRGGENVSPREVEEVLLQHPAVSEAVVFGVPHDALGQDVAAAVVLRDRNATEKQLRRSLATRLAHFKVPSRIVALEALPLGPTGKPQRIGLAEKLGLTGLTAPNSDELDENAPPGTPAEHFLCEAWCEILRLPSVGIHQRFLDMGGDSLLASRIVARVSQQLDVDLTLLEFLDAATIADQASVLAEKLQSA
jgi:acyl-CoA synthetase (AMP-forming)/AMP-acid ligase II